MTLFTLGLVGAIISYVVWAYAATFAIQSLKDRWPVLYERIGSPAPIDIWLRRAIGTPLDRFTMTRAFRISSIQDKDVLRMFEVVCAFRWLQITGFAIAIIGLAWDIG